MNKPTDLADYHYAAIGMVVVETARLEATMCRAVWRALGLSEIDGQVVTSHMDRSALFYALHSLASRCTRCRCLDGLIDNLQAIDALLKERDFMLRAQWRVAMPDGIAIASAYLDHEDGAFVSRALPFAAMVNMRQTAQVQREALERWIRLTATEPCVDGT